MFVLVLLSQTAISAESIQSVVDDYYFLKTIKMIEDKHDNCYPTSSCFRTACDSLRTFECDDQDEMDALRRAVAVFGVVIASLNRKSFYESLSTTTMMKWFRL